MNAHILIVDDDVTIRTTLRRIFEKEGFRTTEALSGAEAIHLLRNQPFDLITMDMAMAQMDGIDTIAIIRSEWDSPILAISAYLTDAVRKDIEAQGVHHCLEKPFSPHDVLSAAYQAMDDSRA